MFFHIIYIIFLFSCSNGFTGIALVIVKVSKRLFYTVAHIAPNEQGLGAGGASTAARTGA